MQKSAGEYKDPVARQMPPEEDTEQAGTEAFESPEGQASSLEESASMEAVSNPQGISRDLLEVKSQIAEMLRGSAVNGVQSLSEDGDGSNILGVGIGLGHTSSSAGARAFSQAVIPGEQTLTVFVRELTSIDAVKSVISQSVGSSAVNEDSFPVSIVETGPIEARANTARVRPAPGGFLVGHYKITAGTIGVFATGNSAPRNARRLMLSNNHVLANVNQGAYGDCITQPGPYDGGKCPADQVAILERFVPINFASGASNVVDCATGWCWADRVRLEEGYQSGGSVVYFRVGSVPVAAQVGMLVGKTGRTTGLTEGRVTAIGVAVNVNYGASGTAHFVNQFSVQGLTSAPFSQGGDSGSLVWTWNSARNPVGLLFAGGGATTFCNPIRSVLAALDIRLTT